jgi:hypothetical protein
VPAHSQRKLIYIAGCGHSGSTLLDLLLSTHQHVCGLGEVAMLVDDCNRPTYTSPDGNRSREEQICSCGQSIYDCSFWSRFLEYTEKQPAADFQDRYARLVKIATDEMGDNVILSDSSKYQDPLQEVTKAIRSGALQPHLGPNELFVVHLIKDARAWVTSMKDRFDLDGWDLVRFYRKWHRDNQQIQSFLEEKRLPSIRVSYEEICFRPHGTLSKIFEAVGIEKAGAVGELAAADAHIGLGNPMRHDDRKSARIEYDPRWFHEPLIQALYYLVPGVRSYNEQHAEDIMPLYLEKRRQ